jgi:predicted  nucleic acid-binding Zn-ribbon protein
LETIKDREFDIKKLNEEIVELKALLMKKSQEIIDLKSDLKATKSELNDEMIKHSITA